MSVLKRLNPTRVTNKIVWNDRRVRSAGLDPAFPLDSLPATTWKEAVQRLVDKNQVGSAKLQEQRMRPFADGAHPDILNFIALFYKRMDGRGIPIFAHTIVRSADEQRALVADGVSRDSPDDGLWPHRGCAVDIIHSRYAWNLSEKEWLIFGEVGKEVAIQRNIDIVWGGDWIRKGSEARVGWDPAHWELRNWRSLVSRYPFWSEQYPTRNEI